MEIEKVRRIAVKKGIRNYDLFSNFIMKRFPSELSETYVGEWAERFLTGEPTMYMDLQSKAIYKELI